MSFVTDRGGRRVAVVAMRRELRIDYHRPLMNYIWWCVRGVPLEQVVSQLLEPSGYTREFRRPSDITLEKHDCLCMSLGDFTFTVVPGRDGGLEDLFARFDRDVLCMIWNDENAWSQILCYHGNQVVWSVSGCRDRESFEIEGSLPTEIEDLFDVDEDRERVPLEIGRRLTGFAIDTEFYTPYPRQIVALNRRPPDVEIDHSTSPPAFIIKPTATLVKAPFEVSYRAGWLQGLARRGDRMLVNTLRQMYALDVGRFPPAIESVGDGDCITAALPPWGGLLVYFGNRDERSSILYERAPDDKPQRLLLPFDSVEALWSLEEGVLAVPRPDAQGDVAPQLITAPRPGERRLTPLRVPVPSGDDERALAASFGDGTFLFAWPGATYHYRNGVLETHPPLNIELTSAFSVAPLARGSLLFASQAEGLVELSSDGRRTRIDGFTRPQLLCPAGDAIAVVDAYHIKLWWPRTRQLTSVADEVFDLEDFAVFLYYDARNDLLVALAEQQLHAVPMRVLAALPRSSARERRP